MLAIEFVHAEDENFILIFSSWKRLTLRKEQA
jgi:hypothetical protein